MNHSDVVNLIIAAGTTTCAILMGFTTWLWKHSSRLTRAEERIAALAENAKHDRAHTDAQFGRVLNTLGRIEDKIDRKADRQVRG